jgi:hypothetical protein
MDESLFRQWVFITRVEWVCVSVSFWCYFNSRFFSHKTFEIRWQIIDNFDPSIIFAFLKTWEFNSGILKLILNKKLWEDLIAYFPSEREREKECVAALRHTTMGGGEQDTRSPVLKVAKQCPLDLWYRWCIWSELISFIWRWKSWIITKFDLTLGGLH